MHFSAWQLWIAAAALFAGSELLHGALVLLAMAIACVPAAAGAALGAGPAFQVLLFSAALIAEYPLVGRLAHLRRGRRLTGNAEAIVGKRVKVLEPVGEQREGVVLLTGEHWKARSISGVIAPGTEAQVVERDGLLLVVVPLER